MSKSKSTSLPKETSETARYNSRATSLFPGGHESTASSQPVLFAENIELVQRLNTLAAAKFTGSIKIDCELNKSRSALLILRGKVLSCVYGELQLPFSIVGESAHEKVLAQLSARRTSMTVWSLSERLVVAASSVFHGATFSVTEESPVLSIERSLDKFYETNTLGSIVLVSKTEGIACVLYIDSHELMGCSSFVASLKEMSFDKLINYLEENPDCIVFANRPKSEKIEELISFSFNLTQIEEIGSEPHELSSSTKSPRTTVEEFATAYVPPSRIQSKKSVGKDSHIFTLLANAEKKNTFKIDTLTED